MYPCLMMNSEKSTSTWILENIAFLTLNFIFHKIDFEHLPEYDIIFCLWLISFFILDGTLKRRHHRNPEGRGQSHLKKLGENSSDSVFVSDNNTAIVAHRGSTTTLHCQVYKDSQYGVVSQFWLLFSKDFQFISK